MDFTVLLWIYGDGMAEIAIDTAIVQQLVEQAVRENILSTLENMVQDSNWLAKIETMIDQTATQKTFEQLKSINIPAIVSKQINKTFDSSAIQQAVTVGVQKEIETAITNISQDPVWLAKIETLINQATTYQTIARIGSMDINTIIKERVDENMEKFREQLRTEFSSVGISDQATEKQLTIMDEATVFENELVTNNLNVVTDAVIQNLTVKGSINTDNFAWNALAASISDLTLEKLSKDWQDQLVLEVADQIRTIGIDFNQVTVDGEKLINGNRLADNIKETNIQSTGVLKNLRVAGEARLTNTVTVVNKRLGINTEEPETALSIWDEEVSVNIGKGKLNQAYIGTSRAQGISIGTNRIPQIEIDADGMTQIKKLRIGVHQISHADIVPGWAGTKGDIVFNTNPKEDRVFAWVCVGNFKWQPLKSAE